MKFEEVLKARHRFLNQMPSKPKKIKFCMNIKTAILFATDLNSVHVDDNDGGSFKRGIHNLLRGVVDRQQQFWRMDITEQFLCELGGMSIYVQIPDVPNSRAHMTLQPDYFISAADG